MSLVIQFLGAALAILLAAYAIPGFHVDGLYTTAIVAITLGFFNATLKPVLTILTLPLSILTLGLFSFVLNAIVILLISSFIGGFAVDGFIPALLGGAVIAFVGWALSKFT